MLFRCTASTFWFIWSFFATLLCFQMYFRGVPTKVGWETASFYVGDSSLKTSDAITFASQVGQDRLVLAILENRERNGYFVDLASNDATLHSNTFTLETYFDWRGVCIEANPQYFHRLAVRKCKKFFGVIGSEPNDVLTFRFDGGTGGIDTKGDAVLHATSLQDVLEYHDAPPVIEYLSLDVEGAELLIMKRFPFDRFIFLVMSIERPGKELHDLVIQKGYTLITVCGHFGDLLYVHKSLPNYEQVLKKHRLDCLVDDYEQSRPWIESHSQQANQTAIFPSDDVRFFGRVCSNTTRLYTTVGMGNLCWEPFKTE